MKIFFPELVKDAHSVNQFEKKIFATHTIQMSTEEKFGPPPSDVHPLVLLAGQFVASIVILMLIRPPFVCSQGHLQVETIVFISLGLTLGSVCASTRNATSADLFRGLVNVISTCRPTN